MSPAGVWFVVPVRQRRSAAQKSGSPQWFAVPVHTTTAQLRSGLSCQYNNGAARSGLPCQYNHGAAEQRRAMFTLKILAWKDKQTESYLMP